MLLVFASSAMAVPTLQVSGVSGIWDKGGTPDDFSDDTITVEFDANPVGRLVTGRPFRLDVDDDRGTLDLG